MAALKDKDPEPSEFYLSRAAARPVPRSDVPTATALSISRLAFEVDYQTGQSALRSAEPSNQETVTIAVDGKYL